MKPLVDARLAIDAAVLAAKNYADLVTDRDPDDGEHVVPGELRRFLARLRLLHGVPFSYLVPDADLLPPESMRFFYIDRAWTDALVQGALSVGTISSVDRTQLEAVYPHIRAEVDEAERTVRMPQREARLQAGSGTVTGFLMRSRAVSGWPNLHVRAYTRDVLPDDALSTVAESDPNRIKALRMERLAAAGVHPELLAINNGSKHGNYLEGEKISIDLDRTGEIYREIHGRFGVSIVQHGLTGTPLHLIGKFAE